MIYKTFQKVSNVCQLLDKSKYPATQTIYGVTFTNNGDGTITVNGTCTNPYYSAYKIKENLDGIISGHKYAILGTDTNMSVSFGASYQGGYIWKVSNNIFTLPENEYTGFSSQIRVTAGVSVSNITLKPQLFDLTEMYGAGNEPTTVEQFRQDFPEELYDYSPHCFVKSYKTLLKVSNVCQLLDKSKYNPSQTINGVTFTNNGDGTFTANGTATANIDYRGVSNKAKRNIIVGHKYLTRGCPVGGSRDTYYFNLPYLGRDYGNGVIAELLRDISNYDGQIIVKAGTVCDNLVFKPQLFDLTEMYGAGNEPTTVEEFRQDFPEKLYDYKPYSIIPSYKKSLVCKTKNLFDINSVTEVRHIRSGLLKPTTRWSIKNNSFITTLNNYNDGVCYILPTLSLEPGIYTFSAFCTSDDELCWFGIYDFTKSEGFDEIYTANKQLSKTFEITEKSEIGLIMQGYSKNFIGTFSNIQLELGDTATDYVPYGHL